MAQISVQIPVWFLYCNYGLVFCWNKSWEASIWTTPHAKTAMEVQRWQQSQSFCYGNDHTS